MLKTATESPKIGRVVMATVCVFTPTYNRAYTLPRLYESLVHQTSTDFTWLVVDDGSEDNTEELLREYQRAGKIQINYTKTPNGGKQRAMNLGVTLCNDELFFVVDSDDYLIPTAVEHFINEWKTEREKPEVCGIVALRGTDFNTPLGTWMPENVDYVKYWDLFESYHYRGDTSLIHRTSILREYPYEIAANEMFIAETAVYYRLDDKYVHKTDNSILTICHYLPDGYTKNVKNNIKNNPIGYYKHKLYCSSRARTLKSQIRETALYEIGCFLAHKKNIIQEAPHKVLATLLYIPAKCVKIAVFG